jgi:hypothetical protein
MELLMKSLMKVCRRYGHNIDYEPVFAGYHNGQFCRDIEEEL